MLLINPHTSFFFRAEAQMVSEEGLNAYGALTWGQFFIYQGFNDKAGWMHTSSSVDNIDEYLETIVEEGRQALLQGRQRRAADHREADRRPVQGGRRHDDRATFTVYYTHRGPIVRQARRQVGQRSHDEQPARRVDAVVLAHQGDATSTSTRR